MLQDEPSYGGYSLEDLLDARDHIDEGAHPDRVKRLDEEIARRDSLPEDPGKSRGVSIGPRSRRLGAFVLDGVVIAILWGVVDNLLFFPMPAAISSILPLLFFLAYFNAFETFGRAAASPGKQVVGLAVRSRDPVTAAQGVGRSVLVAGMVWFDWVDVVATANAPYMVILLILGVQLSLCLFNAAVILLIPPKFEMIQDRLTRTWVVEHDTTTTPSPARSPYWIRMSAVLVASIVIGVGTTAGFVVFLSYWSGTGVVDVLKTPMSDMTEVERVITASIARDTSIRARVDVERLITWHPREGRRTDLRVEVWIPASTWRESIRGQVKRSALRNLRIDAGAFDGGQIVLSTGGFLTITESQELDLP